MNSTGSVVKGPLLTLIFSALLVTYMFYGFVRVPPDIDQLDKVIWIYAKAKLGRTVATLGENLGWDHRVNISRSLASTSTVPPPDRGNMEVEDTHFDGVPVRVYIPKNKVNNGPALVWIHGGGWVFGSVAGDDFICASAADRLGLIVISIEYRRAPEHPYPIPFEDCLKATTHFMNNAQQFGVNPKRIAIAGGSAGANLAAAVSMKLRDIQHPTQPALQILFVPCLQALDFNTPSYQEHAQDFLTKTLMIDFWLWYSRGPHAHRLQDRLSSNEHTSVEAKHSELAKRVDHKLLPRRFVHQSYAPPKTDHGDAALWNDLKGVFLDPYFAPLMADDLRGLAPAYIVTAQYDVLRDDGIMYAKRLEASHVPVKHVHYDSAFHATFHSKSLTLQQTQFNDLYQYMTRFL